MFDNTKQHNSIVKVSIDQNYLLIDLFMNRTIFESYSCSEESVYSTIAENFSSALRLTTPCLPSSEAMDSTQVKWNEQGQDNSGKEIELESSALDNMDDSEKDNDQRTSTLERIDDKEKDIHLRTSSLENSSEELPGLPSKVYSIECSTEETNNTCDEEKFKRSIENQPKKSLLGVFKKSLRRRHRRKEPTEPTNLAAQETEQIQVNVTIQENDSPSTSRQADLDKSSSDCSESSLWKSYEEAWTEESKDLSKLCTIPKTSFSAIQNRLSWTAIDGSLFKVRCGPNYARNKQKQHSGMSLFDTICVKSFSSKKRTKFFASKIPLPKEVFLNRQRNRTDLQAKSILPDFLIINFQIPYETPSLVGAETDVQGGEIILYMTPSTFLCNELMKECIDKQHASVRLFQKWCNQSKNDLKMRSRFKFIVVIDDIESIKGIQFLRSYNGKPALIARGSSVRHGEMNGLRYMEFCTNIHEWRYVSKRGLLAVLPRLQDMKVNIGFTIEGRQEDEMPEQILGAVKLNMFDHKSIFRMPETI